MTTGRVTAIGTALMAASIIEERHGVVCDEHLEELQRDLVSLIARYIERGELQVLREMQEDAGERLKERGKFIRFRHPPEPKKH